MVNNSMHIRKLEPSDAQVLAALQASPYTVRWLETDFADLFIKPHILAYGAWEDQLCGYILISVTAPQADILDFAITPAFRRQGKGRKLLEAILALLAQHNVHELWGEVAIDNDAAWQLYQQYDATQINIRKNYYQLPDGRTDARVFRINL